jgi:hypothetical protein
MLSSFPLNHVILGLAVYAVLRSENSGQTAIFPVRKEVNDMNEIFCYTGGMTEYTNIFASQLAWQFAGYYIEACLYHYLTSFFTKI